jgi:hypothetical protein
MARKSLIEIRRDTATNWTSVDPILAEGEPGYETDTGVLKIGDGSTAWSSLPAFRTDSKLAIGVRWDSSSSDPTLTQINEFGETLSVMPSFFDGHPIFAGIKRCNVADDGTINAWYGDSSFAYDGTNGQVMVYVPKFYYKAWDVDDCKYWVVSDIAKPGYTLHPAFVKDSVEKDYFLWGAFEGSAFDVTADAYEVNTIQVTAEPTSSGDLTITLDGYYSFTVGILDADTIEGVVDKIVAAGNKTDDYGVLWTVAKTAADTLTYTSDTYGLKTTVTMPTANGVTSTITKTTSGAGGYVLADSAGVDFTVTTGDLLSSIAGVKSASGNLNDLTRASSRILAENRGTGWQLIDFNQLSAIQLLFIIEYATLNSQSIFEGVTDLASGTGNASINTGYTAGIGTGASDLGNTSGEVDVLSTQPFSYRGIENFYGNVWKWIDGFNIKADNNPWLADHDYADDTFTDPYVDTGLTIGAVNGYVSNIADYTPYFLPSDITGGNSEKYFTDYYYQAAGNRVAQFGGAWPLGLQAGAFHLYLYHAASGYSRNLGARIAFIPEV